MTLDEMKSLPESEQKRLFDRLQELRKKGKTTNYSSTYGVGKAKLARDLSIPVKVAKDLLDAYWKKNWAIQKVASGIEIKHTGKSMWIKNPVSGFWYQLRSEKDIWSTLNQGTGVYCFDNWLYFVRKLGVKIPMQYHDEKLSYAAKGQEQDREDKLREAIKMTNDKLKLNVPLDIDVKFGKSYSEVH
jgi:DNA polymerase I-like protein with 3'-5' exonuclease and polymerase domains